MRQPTDAELKETGRKAFMMVIDLSMLLVTARGDTRKLKYLEFGYKRAQQEWLDKNRKFHRPRPAQRPAR